MQVVEGLPPNYDAIVAKFGPLPAGVCFAWGDCIYTENYKNVDEHLVVHEMVHRRQQEAVGGPEAWWARYLEDDRFRLDQEIEAYRAQIASYPTRDQRRHARKEIAKQLASSMYGYVISEPAARVALQMSKVVAAA